MKNCTKVMLSLGNLTSVAAARGCAANGHGEAVAKGNKNKFVGNVMVAMTTLNHVADGGAVGDG